MKKELMSPERIAASRYYSELVANGWKIFVWGNLVMPERPAGWKPEYAESHTQCVVAQNQ